MSNSAKNILGAILFFGGLILVLSYYHFVDSYGFFGFVDSLSEIDMEKEIMIYSFELPIFGDIAVINTDVDKYIVSNLTSEEMSLLKIYALLGAYEELDSVVFYVGIIIFILGLIVLISGGERMKRLSYKETMALGINYMWIMTLPFVFCLGFLCFISDFYYLYLIMFIVSLFITMILYIIQRKMKNKIRKDNHN